MKPLFAVLLFAATSAFAQPVIHSVSPSSAPAAGGTVVTIKGTGFHECLFCNPVVGGVPVYFGGMVARATVVDGQTLRVAVPPHLPGTVRVLVLQDDGQTTLNNAFTYTGTIEENFERVLLPIFVDPIPGAFGSRFVTELRVANPYGTPANLIGFLPLCHLSACIFVDPLETLTEIAPGHTLDPEAYTPLGRPGWFVFVPNGSAQPAFNLRVFDDSRTAFNFGTEIPVVHERELSTDPMKLLGVPLDPRFRNMLRLYATGATSVTIHIGDRSWVVPLTPGRNPLEPAYAQFTDFPAGTGTVDVTVVPSTDALSVPGFEPERVWAFVSVTNNETQLISTISPQR